MPPSTPHNRPTIAKAEWVGKAVRMANKGWTHRSIAAKLGLHHSTVQEALQKEYERVRPSEAEIEAFRERKAERLYGLLRKWRPLALQGAARAADIVLRLEDAIARLEGTDAPKRTELTGKDGGPLASMAVDLTALTDEQIDGIVRGDLTLAAGASGAGEAPQGADAERDELAD